MKTLLGPPETWFINHIPFITYLYFAVFSNKFVLVTSVLVVFLLQYFVVRAVSLSLAGH